MAPSDLITSAFSPLLRAAYRVGRLRGRALALAGRAEGGQFRSATLRAILRDFHEVEIGAYSYGSCFVPGAFPAGATIGRYVSMASGVKRRLNHPLQNLVLHPYFYNDRLGFVPARTISHAPISIGHDAWIGEGVLFTEGCTRVGTGAVVGAGSVVTRNVGDFEVVAGNPARLLRRRFRDDTCDRILASRWWERSVEDLAQFAPDLNAPLEGWRNDHPLFAAR